MRSGGGKINRKIDVAVSIMARDYKGLSQWGSNAVAIPNKPYLKIKVANKKGYDEAYEGDSVNMEYPSSTTRRGRVGGGIAQTVDTGNNQGVVVNVDRNRKENDN